MDEFGTRARKELSAPWDDVREARVLTRILSEADVEPARRRRQLLTALSLAAAFAIAGVGWRHWSAQVSPIATPLPVTASAVPSGTSRLALADGSKAYLMPGAELEPLEQSARVVRISQRRGEVRYEVKPDATRVFSVRAHDVDVRVIGTIFTVAVESGGVLVSVGHGRVSVQSGARRVELASGETLRLSSELVAAAAQEPAAPLPAASNPSVSSARTVASASDSAAAGTTPAELLADADAARGRGDLALAERLLAALVSKHPNAPQATSAAFSLGRIQSARGNFATAAQTFQRLLQRAPSGPLAEDALAEAANAVALSGQGSAGRELALKYLAQYPKGAHAERMRRLGKP
jgi:TolA-binding protein